MKIYRVSLYQLSSRDFYTGIVTYVDDIFIKKGIFGVKEVFTNFSEIDILTKSCFYDDLMYPFYKRFDRVGEDGTQLFIMKDSINEANLVNPESIDEYIDRFDDSKWKITYDRISQRRERLKNKTRNKIKIINSFEGKRYV